MRKFIIIGILSCFLVSCERNYIKNIQIEGISLGDSALDFFDENQIKDNEWDYYKNKYFYLTRDPMTFNSFNTIMRQIMKKNDIIYTNKIKYTSSKYQVEYHIHKTQFDTSIASMQINNCS